jgi:hypoxanthine phosphoribosyltransferase
MITEFIPAKRIHERIRELGKEITEEHAGLDELVVVAVLKGAFIFTADLVREIRLPCRIEFIRASSYGTRQSSAGRVTLQHELNLQGRNVLLVEDIIDTGLTLSTIIGELRKLEPASLKICSLLDKPSARKFPVHADYTGFSIPDHFVVGYGLDDAERYRELPFIALPGA